MTTLNTNEALQVAMRHHQDGQLAQAETIYRQILSAWPNHSDALHMLGILALQSGRTDDGIVLVRRAIESQPCVADYHNSLGNALGDKKSYGEAIAEYRQALSLRPNFAEAHNNLGIALQESGQIDRAIASFRQAIDFKSDYFVAYNNLGNALQNRQDYAAAIDAYRQALRLRPNYFEALHNLGDALANHGKPQEAIDAYRQAAALRPNIVETRINRGNALRATKRFEEAIAEYRHVLNLKPDFAEVRSNLGNVYRDLGRTDEAIAEHREAIRLKPDYAEAHSNLANELFDKGVIDEAISANRRAIELNPQLVDAHYGLANCLLLKGDFANGWREYEWRWSWKDFPSKPRNFPRPQWDGSPLDGRTILLHAEQGLGDTIQFIRYASLVAGKGGKVLFGCPPSLCGLLQDMPGIERVIRTLEELPDFDFHCPLLSVPLALGTRMDTIPADIPYLKAREDLTRQWAARMAEHSGKKVGIAWAGAAHHINDRHRSFALSSLAPLACGDEITFFSLQKGDAAAQASSPPPGMKLIDYTAELNDFSDTAALIANLDLVIAADTAVAHLAGAMGKSVWVLLPFVPDWRWQLDRQDSPWYPTMKLFRQRERGDWTEVVGRVAGSLRSIHDQK